MTRDPFADPVWRESAHPSSIDEESLLADVEMTRGRTSGPGGQHRNRVATHVELTHRPTGVAAQAGERRSPEQNRAVAMRRLRLALATQHRSAVPDGEARTELWHRRCTKDGRIVCAERHHDFPALIAEALDVVAACGWDTRTASTRLCCSQTQLVKLVARHPPALDALNSEREKRGLRRLHAR